MLVWVVILFSSLVCAAPMEDLQLQPQLEPTEHVEYWMKTSRQHPHPLIRKNAVRVLGTLKEKISVPTLIEALHDENHQVRLEAAKALGRQGDERAFGPLREVIDRDADHSVRREARRAVELINAYLEYQKKNEDEENPKSNKDES